VKRKKPIWSASDFGSDGTRLSPRDKTELYKSYDVNDNRDIPPPNIPSFCYDFIISGEKCKDAWKELPADWLEGLDIPTQVRAK